MATYIQINKTVIIRMVIFVLLILGAVDLVAQEKAPEAKLTWKNLGFDGFPEGMSTNELAMIKGLNKSRGIWVFEGSVSDGDENNAIHGNLEINGSIANGMLPMWGMVLNWPRENPKHLIQYVLMVAPEKNKVGMSLIRFGPIHIGDDGKPSKEAMMKAKRIPFEGTWDLAQRKVLWKEKEIPGSKVSQLADSETIEKESFEMVIGVTGEIIIQNHQRGHTGPVIVGKTTERKGKPAPEETLSFNKDIHFASFEDITEPRIKKYIPSKATDITLHLQRGGHFARYKVAEKDFLSFLDTLWKEEQREEGNSVKREVMLKRFGRLGWTPPENAVSYHSPVQPNGAMRIYYFDQQAGIVYEDTGYW